MADGLGFVGGSAWTEGNVGTNAIGTALVLGEAVQIRGAEHYVESHSVWGCAAAPLRRPVDRRAPSGSSTSAGRPGACTRPSSALVTLAARLSALETVAGHRETLDRLRSLAAPMVARLTGQALVVDHAGHTRRRPPASGRRDRVALPERPGGRRGLAAHARPRDRRGPAGRLAAPPRGPARPHAAPTLGST